MTTGGMTMANIDQGAAPVGDTSDDQRRAVIKWRGGCQCAGGRAPCWACESPITWAEAEELCLPLLLTPTERAVAMDILSITRELCR